MTCNIEKRLKIILLILALIALGIQFFRPSENTGKAFAPSFTDTFRVNDTVKNILATSCFNCHSNNTSYPWYTNIQPIGWIMYNHIKKGKRELNFDELASLSVRRRNTKFRSAIKQIEQNKMPLRSYLLLHPKAKLDDTAKNILISFFDSKINNN